MVSPRSRGREHPVSLNMTPQSAARLLVTVGTDHHQFGRLMDWVGRYLGRMDLPQVTCLVQHGTSVPPAAARSVAYLPGDELRRAIQTSSIVVTHGGPSTIMECRAAGILPVVVARRADYGEHVDDHQVRFTRRLAEANMIRLVEDEDEFHSVVRAGLADPKPFRIRGDVVDSAGAIGRIAALIDELFGDFAFGQRSGSQSGQAVRR